MQKFEKPARIIHVIVCVLNLGSLFFGLMLPFAGSATSWGSSAYLFFKGASLALALPMFFMRIIYLQYILFGILAVFSVIHYMKAKKNHTIIKKRVFIDCVLWAITVFELIFLEEYFLNIIAF